MATKKEKNPHAVKMTTPRGTFKFPNLAAPSTKFKDEGEYDVKVVLDKSDPKVAELLKRLDALLDKSKELAEEAFDKLPVKQRKAIEAKSKGIVADAPYAEVYDEETEEPTGQVELKASMRASGERKDGTKWKASPALFDAKAKPFPKGVNIWGGTVGIVSFVAEPYFMEATGAYGVRRKLTGAQIIELVSEGYRSADSLGFEAQDDGFDGSNHSSPDTSYNAKEDGGNEDDAQDF